MFRALSSSLRSVSKQCRRSTTSSASLSTAAKRKLNKEFLKTELIAGSKLFLIIALGTSGTLAVTGFMAEKYEGYHSPSAPGNIVKIISTDKDEQTPIVCNLNVMEEGKDNGVTVILDGTCGATSMEWCNVQKDIGKFARVIAVDRPGLGYSDHGVLPRTSKQIAGEYLKILKEMNVSGPVILVGHGTGSYNMRSLSQMLSQSPDLNVSCAGMILIDPAEENIRTAMENIAPAIGETFKVQEKNVALLHTLSHFGIPRLIEAARFKAGASNYTPEVEKYARYIISAPKHRLGVVHENNALSLTEALFREEAPDSSNLSPVLILSHGEKSMFETMIYNEGIDESMVTAMESTWSEGQENLVRTLQQNNRLVLHKTVAGAGHHIAHEKPQDVIAAVLAMVNEIQDKPEGGLNAWMKEKCPV